MRYSRRLLRSLGAVLTSKNSASGTIYLEEASMDKFIIKSCSRNSVTIDVATGVDVKEAFEPGRILVYLGRNDLSICGHCHTLFRKIVAQGENEDTLVTEFASFADIFPYGAYDDSLADFPIEPRLLCNGDEGHEDPPWIKVVQSAPVFVPVSSPDMEKQHRLLQSDTFLPTQAPTLVVSFTQYPTEDNSDIEEEQSTTDSFCVGETFFIVLNILLVICFLACFPIGIALTVLGIALDTFANCSPGDFRRSRYLLSNLEVRMLQEVPRNQIQQSMDHPLFPVDHEDWMKTDIEGNCLFVDCNVGTAKGNLSNCFKCRRSDDLSCSHTTCPGVSNDMIYFPTISSPMNNFDFKEACKIQDVCYSSMFDKAVCDENFYKATQFSCPRLSGSMGSFVETIFPLSESDLNQNCDLLSILLFIAVKDFGYDAYEELQLKKHEHQELNCNNNGKDVQL